MAAAAPDERTPVRLKVLLAVLGTLLGLVLAEGLVRLLPVEVRGYTYADGVLDRAPEFTPDPTTNGLGLHDAPLEPPTPGTNRVLLLGDSYVAARSMPVPLTVGQRLEHHLEAQGGAWEVISIGGNGWGQGEQLAALQLYGDTVKPDLVLTLFVAENDVRNNLPELQAIGRQQIDQLTRYRPGWIKLHISEAPFLFLPSSELNRFVSWRMAGQRLITRAEVQGMEAVPIDYLVYADTPTAAWTAAWEHTGQLLEQHRAEARRLGADFAVASASLPQGVLPEGEGAAGLVTAYPPLSAYDLDLDRPDQRLAELCKERGIPLLVMQPTLRAIQQDEDVELHWPQDGHWNREGNDRAAQLLAAFVREQVGQ